MENEETSKRQFIEQFRGIYGKLTKPNKLMTSVLKTID
jgi:hypothetical protein